MFNILRFIKIFSKVAEKLYILISNISEFQIPHITTSTQYGQSF